MLHLLLAALLTQAPPQPSSDVSSRQLAEAEHAISAGRLEQARIMIATAMRSGATGHAVDRLLADLSFATGDYHVALGRYEALLQYEPANSLLAERAGIAAFRTGKLKEAEDLLNRATRQKDASWQAWNARGVVADHLHDWQSAEESYARAAELAPGSPEVLNNMGWSLLLQGEWHLALELLRSANALDPKSQRIADNLELARAAVSEDLPRRLRGESDEQWAARLNDLGVVAIFRGEQQRAVAAFTQALTARSQWFERAANNLSLAEARR